MCERERERVCMDVYMSMCCESFRVCVKKSVFVRVSSVSKKKREGLKDISKTLACSSQKVEMSCLFRKQKTEKKVILGKQKLFTIKSIFSVVKVI